MIGIVRAYCLAGVTRIVAVMATQMGKSANILNVIGHRLNDNPGPIIYIGPTQSNIDNVVEPKVVELLRGSASLWKKAAKGKKSTKHHKRISGVSLRLGWAGSASELASDSAVLGFVDEVDRMQLDIRGEGDPVEQVEARTGTYADGKIGITSTPTTGNVKTSVDERTGLTHWSVEGEISSRVWSLWQEGSRHEWSVPCPDCNEYFIPRFALLWWPKGTTPEAALKRARLTCPQCGSQIEDSKRLLMNSRGVYVAPGQKPLPYQAEAECAYLADYTEKPDLVAERGADGVYAVAFGDAKLPANQRSVATFWVSGLCSFSAKKTYGFIAAKWLRAVKSGEPERIQGVINLDFGELYAVTGDAPEWESVRDLGKRSHYILGQVPSDIVTLVAGIDVQKNRLVYVVRGFGEAYGSALIERGELWGETDLPDVWTQLDALLTKEWDSIPLSKMTVDSGYRSEEVYDFCRKHSGTAIPTKGHDHLDKPYYAKLIDVNIRGRLIKNGVQLWHFDSDSFKSWVHSRVDWPEDQPGVWLLPSDIDEDYCKQIVAEQRIQKSSGGSIWIKTAVDNHFLDCEALAYLAIRINGIVKKLPKSAQQSVLPPPQRQQPSRFARRSI